MRVIGLVTAVLLTGCSTLPPDNPFTPSTNRVTDKTKVTWEMVDDIDKTCRERGVKLPDGYVAGACTSYTKDWCHITTGRTTTLYVLGHELRHCFEGAWHDEHGLTKESK